MDLDYWLLPEGIEEALPEQAERLEYFRRRLIDLYHTWGYALVMPPFIEYLESLTTGVGRDLERQTFKLTDRLTGRLLGVRADMTPQVARIDAHRLKRDTPVRLCYIGTVLKTQAEVAGDTRTPLQVGAELFGHAGTDSDAEIISLLLETLGIFELSPVHLDLGHVGIYRALARQASLNNDQEYALFDMLQRKALPEITDYLAQLDLAPVQRRMLGELARLNGDVDMLKAAQALLAQALPEAQAALHSVQDVGSILARRYPHVELHYDLAELRGYTYHTGIVFGAFVPGQGQEIARGGRYDEIGRHFGRARPATGFSTDLQRLVALTLPTPQPVAAIFAPAVADEHLEQRIGELRTQGERVIRELAGQPADARAMGCNRALVKHKQQWQLKDL